MFNKKLGIIQIFVDKESDKPPFPNSKYLASVRDANFTIKTVEKKTLQKQVAHIYLALKYLLLKRMFQRR